MAFQLYTIWEKWGCFYKQIFQTSEVPPSRTKIKMFQNLPLFLAEFICISYTQWPLKEMQESLFSLFIANVHFKTLIHVMTSLNSPNHVSLVLQVSFKYVGSLSVWLLSVWLFLACACSHPLAFDLSEKPHDKASRNELHYFTILGPKAPGKGLRVIPDFK